MLRRRKILFLLMAPLALAVSVCVQLLLWRASLTEFDWTTDFDGSPRSLVVDEQTGRIFLLAEHNSWSGTANQNGFDFLLHCVDADGKPLWQQMLHVAQAGVESRALLEPELLLQDGSVQICLSTGERRSYDLDGNMLWSALLPELSAANLQPDCSARYAAADVDSVTGYDGNGNPVWNVGFELPGEILRTAVFCKADGNFLAMAWSWFERREQVPTTPMSADAYWFTIETIRTSHLQLREISARGELLSSTSTDGKDLIVDNSMYMFDNGRLVDLPDFGRLAMGFCGTCGPGQAAYRSWPDPLADFGNSEGGRLEPGYVQDISVHDGRPYILVNRLWRMDEQGGLECMSGPDCQAWSMDDSGALLTAHRSWNVLGVPGLPVPILNMDCLELKYRPATPGLPRISRFPGDIREHYEMELACGSGMQLAAWNDYQSRQKTRLQCKRLR
ncbi:hypothetical protein KDL44_12635 [bacterium]|nr:hypothetical protein [bacterium]